jgi:hypothetical protein
VGPILFTAPHGLKLHRGGEEQGERVRIHLRERWSSEIAAKLARACEQHTGFLGSLLVWNPKTAKKKDPANLDPNYLNASQQPASPWHHMLHRFRQRFDGNGGAGGGVEEAAGGGGGAEGQRGGSGRRGRLSVSGEASSSRGVSMPMLHVDVHGKKDRKTNLDLDVGLGPMEVLWDLEGVTNLKRSLEAGMSRAFADLGKTFRCVRHRPFSLSPSLPLSLLAYLSLSPRWSSHPASRFRNVSTNRG